MYERYSQCLVLMLYCTSGVTQISLQLRFSSLETLKLKEKILLDKQFFAGGELKLFYFVKRKTIWKRGFGKLNVY